MKRFIYDGPEYPPYARTKADFEYEAKKNRLIPFAKSIADKKHGATPGIKDRALWGAAWNSCFFAEMRTLCREIRLNSF